MKKILQAMFCLGLVISLFPTQIFAQETIPVLEIQDQINDEEMDQDLQSEESIPVDESLEEENTEEEIEETTDEDNLEVLNPEDVNSEECNDSDEKKVPEEEPEIMEPSIEVPEEEPDTNVVKPEPDLTNIESNVEKKQGLPIQKQNEIVVDSVPATIQTPTYIPALNPEYEDKGYEGTLKEAILFDNFTTKNYTRFLYKENPFMVGQCTWFAWSRFYQIYGFDSGAHGNGKTNALEIVEAHPDKFELSSTPAAGSVFSMEKNTLYPEYGHVGFIEAFDGEYVWISEGNVKIGDSEGNIWIHKVKWKDFKAQYPDVVFAVPKVDTVVKERFMDTHKAFFFYILFKKNVLFF